MAKIALTGIKPTGTAHIGNYLGAIRPAIELIDRYMPLYFIADYHALTTVKDPKLLKEQTYGVAATWLACGLDPEKVIFYKQSDIPEIFEFNWILSCFISKGLLNRAHAYKTVLENNGEPGKNPETGVNVGLFSYPVLMAADIVLFGTNVVPVGVDQKQHVEIARDIAQSFNTNYGKILTLPEPLINEDVKSITGLDGRKMSKNYNNVIPLFAPSNQVKKWIMRIVTDSKTPEEPKNAEACNIFAVYRHFANPQEIDATRKRYESGGLGYGEMKQTLFEVLEKTFQERRKQYDFFLSHPQEIEKILREGANKARKIAKSSLLRIRKKIGILDSGVSWHTL